MGGVFVRIGGVVASPEGFCKVINSCDDPQLAKMRATMLSNIFMEILPL